MGERGSISLVAVGILAVVGMAMLLLGQLGADAVRRARAAAIADVVAMAAAAEPSAGAGMAAANGATLASVDQRWLPDRGGGAPGWGNRGSQSRVSAAEVVAVPIFSNRRSRTLRVVSIDPGRVSDPPAAPVPAPASARQPVKVTPREYRRAVRLQARKVRRVIRHIEPWSVLKISLLFYMCLWVIVMLAGVMLWSIAVGSGTVDDTESFIEELFALQEFSFNASQIFRGFAVGGLVLVVGGTFFNVLLCVLFNLISDLTGGMRVTIIEEETARQRPRTRPPRFRWPSWIPRK